MVVNLVTVAAYWYAPKEVGLGVCFRYEKTIKLLGEN